MANRSRVICWCVAFVCASLFQADAQTSSSATPAGETFALVVGISRYPKLPGGHQLQFADRDARLFADSIKKAGVNSANVRLLVGAEATAAAIKAALGAWLPRTAYPSATVYIFFSGHGLVEREFGEAYLLAYDSDPKDAFATAVSINDINRAVNRRIKARQILIIADAVKRDLFNPDTDGAEGTKLFTDAFSTLANSREGVSVVLASGVNEFSREGQRWGGGGVFTKYAVDALAGGADLNADGSVTGKEFFDFVFNHVAEDTANKQHPWLAASTLDQISLSRTALKPATAATAPKPAQSEPRRQAEVARAADPTATRAPPGESSTGETRNTTGADNLPAATRTTGTTTAVSPGSAPGKVSARNNEPAAKRPVDTVVRRPTSPDPSPGTTRRASKGTPTTRAPRRSPTAAGKEAKSTSVQPATTDRPLGEDRIEAQPPIVSEAKPNNAGGPGPKPPPAPPSVGTVAARTSVGAAESVGGSLPSAGTGRAPSPLVLETAAAISAGALIEPRNANAWDYYQKLVQDPDSASEVARLKPLLAEALLKTGRYLVIGDVRADNVSANVDEFRRGGQMLARLRLLSSESPESLTLEKLSAAQALIALQFYEEAEKSLTQLQSSRLAAVENALGLAHMGNFNEFQAERAFKRAIELDMNLAAPHYNLATLYRNQKKEALGEFERAAALDSSNVAVLIAMADEYFSKEKWVEAAEAYRKAIALDPASETLHTKLGHALYSQGLRDEANKAYQKAKEIRGKH